jgi:SAM-dependent methyltransferase
MHPASYVQMEKNLSKYLDLTSNLVVGDVGSYDVNGSYKTLMPDKFSYFGIDYQDGPNVDIVMTSMYSMPVEGNYFDVIISGQCFEHVKNPFKLMKELSRVTKPGGLFILTAPFRFAEHKYPVDCWRFLCDGWQSLFDENNIEMICTEYVKAHKGNVDCWAIGRNEVS